MAEKESSFKNMVLALVSVTLIAGVALGYVYSLTKNPIERAQKEKQEEAIKEVAPPYDNDPIAEKYNYTLNEGTKDSLTLTVFPLKKGTESTGAVVETITKKGFSGEIRIMIGFNLDGTIRNYKVLKHAETPGLGSKMDEWFRSESGRRSVIGKNPGTDNLKVDKDQGNIDAITAATISSRAFLDAIEIAYAAFTNRVDASMSASYKTDSVKQEEGKK